ncbi:hypothetical protein QQF64_032776 [Cirrhinus molitorella]|uniref:Uncharacterized protein n=1 Tax=Cirrhinus molitorella TaxID=172907 RepID=A0ABR3MS14_9TELE
MTLLVLVTSTVLLLSPRCRFILSASIYNDSYRSHSAENKTRDYVGDTLLSPSITLPPTREMYQIGKIVSKLTAYQLSEHRESENERVGERVSLHGSPSCCDCAVHDGAEYADILRLRDRLSPWSSWYGCRCGEGISRHIPADSLAREDGSGGLAPCWERRDRVSHISAPTSVPPRLCGSHVSAVLSVSLEPLYYITDSLCRTFSPLEL